MKTAVAALLAVGLFSGTASARTIFDHIRDFAPKSNFDQMKDAAPRSDGVFGRLQKQSP